MIIAQKFCFGVFLQYLNTRLHYTLPVDRRGRETMVIHGSGHSEGKSWDEKPISEQGGTKLAVARVVNQFQGTIEGQGTLEYLLAYNADGTCTYIGMEHVIGKIGDRAGSFILEHKGVWTSNTAHTTWAVVTGSGTGDLVGLRGQGGFAATSQDKLVPYTFDYELA
jgi:hypothetical protein